MSLLELPSGVIDTIFFFLDKPALLRMRAVNTVCRTFANWELTCATLRVALPKVPNTLRSVTEVYQAMCNYVSVATPEYSCILTVTRAIPWFTGLKTVPKLNLKVLSCIQACKIVIPRRYIAITVAQHTIEAPNIDVGFVTHCVKLLDKESAIVQFSSFLEFGASKKWINSGAAKRNLDKVSNILISQNCKVPLFPSSRPLESLVLASIVENCFLSPETAEQMLTNFITTLINDTHTIQPFNALLLKKLQSFAPMTPVLEISFCVLNQYAENRLRAIKCSKTSDPKYLVLWLTEIRCAFHRAHIIEFNCESSERPSLGLVKKIVDQFDQFWSHLHGENVHFLVQRLQETEKHDLNVVKEWIEKQRGTLSKSGIRTGLI